MSRTIVDTLCSAHDERRLYSDTSWSMKIFVSTALGLDVEDGAGVAGGSDIAASRGRIDYGKMR
jgi:hypothetical protein